MLRVTFCHLAMLARLTTVGPKEMQPTRCDPGEVGDLGQGCVLLFFPPMFMYTGLASSWFNSGE